LFNARRGALQNEFDILKENIEGMEEYIRRLDELQASRSKQMELLRSEMDSLKTMAEEGYYPRAKLLEMERMFAELSGKRSEDLGNIARTKKTVSEYKLTILRREHEFLKDVEAQLSEVQKNLGSLQDQYAASMDVLNKTEMKAPEDGTVVGLVVHTTGGVVMPGHTIMHLVPKDAGLIVDARVNTSDRDKVRIGLPVNLMFPAFNTRTTPVIEGEVTLISADRLQDEGSHTPYYLCRVKITEDGMRHLGDQHLEPGMPAQVVIKTGARTMMNYLVKPFFDRVSVSLKER
jgi:HlyD family type I secretion membrane fusion protein